MKHFKNLAGITLLLCALSFTACKKNDDSSAAKTLNKTTLTSKAWYNQGGSIIHDFRGNNVYSNTGTWRWVGNSDTLEIVPSAGGFKTYWKMNWNTDHEMNCRKVGSADELYKDQFWQ